MSRSNVNEEHSRATLALLMSSTKTRVREIQIQVKRTRHSPKLTRSTAGVGWVTKRSKTSNGELTFFLQYVPMRRRMGVDRLILKWSS